VTRNNLSINVDQAARIDFTPEPGTVTESVNITSIEPPLERETSAIGQHLENKATESNRKSGLNERMLLLDND